MCGIQCGVRFPGNEINIDNHGGKVRDCRFNSDRPISNKKHEGQKNEITNKINRKIDNLTNCEMNMYLWLCENKVMEQCQESDI